MNWSRFIHDLGYESIYFVHQFCLSRLIVLYIYVLPIYSNFQYFPQIVRGIINSFSLFSTKELYSNLLGISAPTVFTLIQSFHSVNESPWPGNTSGCLRKDITTYIRNYCKLCWPVRPIKKVNTTNFFFFF